MASIYLKESEKTCILEPRQALFRRMAPLNPAWTEARVGMFWGGIATTGDNNQNVNETVTLTTYLDRMAFGLRSGSGLPGEVGTNFIGVSNWGNAISNAGNRFVSNDGLFNNSMMAVATVGTSYNLNYTFNNNTDMTFGTVTGATNYCGFYVVKIVVGNPGTATQNVTITASRTTGFPGPYGADELRIRMNNATFSASLGTLAWNDGVTARALPDTIFLRMPFFNNRVRVSAIRAMFR